MNAVENERHCALKKESVSWVSTLLLSTCWNKVRARGIVILVERLTYSTWTYLWVN